jgi:hypothetical protein
MPMTIGKIVLSYCAAKCRALSVGMLACTLATAPARASQPDAATLEASVGGVVLRLVAPHGQGLAAGALAPIYRLHDLSGDGLHALGVYLSPETDAFFQTPRHALPKQGLLSTLIVTERELEARAVDHAPPPPPPPPPPPALVHGARCGMCWWLS